MLYSVLIVVHLTLAIVIVGLVLIQRGKGAEAGAGFGAGASGTVFGARGTHTVFSRATAVLATLFFATSALLAFIGQPKVDTRTDLDRRIEQQQAEADKQKPATPATGVTPAAGQSPAATTPANQPAQGAPATPVQGNH